MHGKIMELEKIWIIIEKSWNFAKRYGKTTSSQKNSCQTLVCQTASFLATGGFKFFKNACIVYKHAVVAAFRIYAQRGKVVAKRGFWSLCIK